MKDNTKRIMRAVSYLIYIPFIIYLIYIEMYIFSAINLAIWYLMYGFVYTASICFRLKCLKIGSLFIKLTFPYLLLRVVKTYYYWLKASIEAEKKNNNISLDYALKVNVQKLGTVNDRSLFYSFIASLYYLNGFKNEALKSIDKAIKLPHKEYLDAHYQNLYLEIKGESSSC